MLFPTATIGDVSVNPYPCTILKPKFLNFSSIFASKLAAPLINNLIFPPSSSCKSLKIAFLFSIESFLCFSSSINISSKFPFFSICFLTILNNLSYIAGTDAITDALYSFRFSGICLIPSLNTICAPIYSGYKNPTVHSNTWCNGKNDKNISLEFTSNVDAISIKFEHIFLCDNATAFDCDVVPDVNNIILIFLLSISAFVNLVSPFSTSFLPFSINSFCEIISSSVFSKSIEIIYFKFLFLTFFSVSIYFPEQIIASTSERFSKLSNSFSGKDLSKGTTIPVPHTIDKYAISHSKRFSPITAILLSLSPISIRDVPKPSIIFLTSSCVYVLYFPSSLRILYAIFFPYFCPDFFNMSFKSVISMYLYNLSIILFLIVNLGFVEKTYKPYIFIPLFLDFVIILIGQYKNKV